MPIGEHRDSPIQDLPDNLPDAPDLPETSYHAPPRETGNVSNALYVVATPLGNLDDITLRAIATLRAVDLIAAEDTRTSATLLRHHGIDTKTMAAHQHNEEAAAVRITALLQQGRAVALISDAGTPAVSDPGARIVRAVRAAGFAVIPLPGPNAVVTALSASGFEGPFYFAGFLPPKSAARSKALEGLCTLAATLVLYEAPHRIVDLAQDLAAVFEADRRIVIARELTKRFETIHACAVGEAQAWLAADPNQQRGEFVVLIEAAPPREGLDDAARRVLGILLAELPVKTAAALTARITGQSKNALYQQALALKSAEAEHSAPESSGPESSGPESSGAGRA